MTASQGSKPRLRLFSFDDYRLLINSMRQWSRQKTRAAAIYALCAAILDVGVLVALVPLISIVMGGSPGMVMRAINRLVPQSEQLAASLLFFLAMMAARSWISVRREQAALALQTAYTAHLQKAVMDALARAAWRDVEALRHARITQALGAEILRGAASAQQIMQILGAAMVLGLQWLLALALAPAIALATVVVFAAGSLGLVRTMIRTSAIGAEINQRNLSLVHVAQQFLGGLKLAKAQNAEIGFTAEFEHLTGEMMDIRYSYQARQIRFRQALTFGAAASAGLMLVIGKVAGFDAVRLFTAFAVLTRVSSAATALVQMLQQLSAGIPSHTYLVDLIAELRSYDASPKDDAVAATQAQLPQVAAHGELVRLDHVTYRTNTAERISDVSFAINAGEVVALSGESGAGKSTTVDLISGLLAPTEGTVWVHGVALGPSNGRAWRDRLAYVTQETWLINDTIRANLTWAHAGASDEELMWALDIAAASAIVQKSEAGLETIVNERGSRFSGGERQRLSLARAILRRPDLLILDEATNALDPEAERIIFERLLQAMPRLSIIVIAHRPSTLALCDREITLQRGRVVPSLSGKL